MSDFVTIRGLQNEDWEALYALWNTPDILLNSFELPYATEDAFRDRWLNANPHPHLLIGEAGLSSGRRRIFGMLWLTALQRRRRHAGQIGLAVHPEYRETEAETRLFEAGLDLANRWLALRRLEAVLYADHAAALALFARYGFEQEATLRRYAVRNGILADALLLARRRAPILGEAEG